MSTHVAMYEIKCSCRSTHLGHQQGHYFFFGVSILGSRPMCTFSLHAIPPNARPNSISFNSCADCRTLAHHPQLERHCWSWDQQSGPRRASSQAPVSQNFRCGNCCTWTTRWTTWCTTIWASFPGGRDQLGSKCNSLRPFRWCSGTPQGKYRIDPPEIHGCRKLIGRNTSTILELFGPLIFNGSLEFTGNSTLLGAVKDKSVSKSCFSVSGNLTVSGTFLSVQDCEAAEGPCSRKFAIPHQHVS